MAAAVAIHTGYPDHLNDPLVDVFRFY